MTVLNELRGETCLSMGHGFRVGEQALPDGVIVVYLNLGSQCRMHSLIRNEAPSGVSCHRITCLTARCTLPVYECPWNDRCWARGIVEDVYTRIDHRDSWETRTAQHITRGRWKELFSPQYEADSRASFWHRVHACYFRSG